MPRIRTVKPEFWTDGAMLRLSDSCRLFFIGLWNFCDDEGKHPYDLDQLVAELGSSWDRGKVRLFVTRLVFSGQLRISSDSAWIQVTGWSHQRIDKPKQPKIFANDLQWLSDDESKKLLESSKNIPRKDRIGKDRIGKDRIKAAKSDRQEIVKPDKQGGALDASASPAEILNPVGYFIGAYRKAYQARYGEDAKPAITGQVTGQIKNLLADKGMSIDRACSLIQTYCQMSDSWFLTKAHDFGTFTQNLSKVGLALDTGKTVTRAEANNADNADYYKNQLKRIQEGKL